MLVCDKIPWSEATQRSKGFILTNDSGGIKSTEAGKADNNQNSGNRNRKLTGHISFTHRKLKETSRQNGASKPICCDRLPLARLYLLMVPEPPQIATSTGDQVNPRYLSYSNHHTQLHHTKHFIAFTIDCLSIGYMKHIDYNCILPQTACLLNHVLEESSRYPWIKDLGSPE